MSRKWIWVSELNKIELLFSLLCILICSKLYYKTQLPFIPNVEFLYNSRILLANLMVRNIIVYTLCGVKPYFVGILYMFVFGNWEKHITDAVQTTHSHPHTHESTPGIIGYRVSNFIAVKIKSDEISKNQNPLEIHIHNLWNKNKQPCTESCKIVCGKY